MIIEKVYIGKSELPTFKALYYVLKKGSFYGIEIVEDYGQKLLSTYEYFTENAKVAHDFVKLCCQGSVTLTTLTDIIDDVITTSEQITA